MRRFLIVGTLLAAGSAGLWMAAPGLSGTAEAQTRKPPRGTVGGLKQLDVKANDLIDGFVRDSADLAVGYEQAGELDKAKQILKAVLALRPDTPGVEQKIKQIDEEMLSSNAVKVTVEVNKGWGTPVAQVTKEKPFRIQSEGTYKFIANATVGPDGFPSADPIKGDMAVEIPCGALMGVIISKGKPGKPFLIGSEREYQPKEDGILFLAVNLPPGSKCTGRLEVQLSGGILRP